MTAASCYLFRGLPAEKMAVIDPIGIPQNIACGQWLFHRADKARKIYLVEEGAIELVMPVAPDIEVPVALIRPGNDCVGIGALLEPYTYTLSARCKESSRLVAIAGNDLRSLFKSDPDCGQIVMTNLAQRLLERLVDTREEVKIHLMNLIQSATLT
jgi:CRP-like cAMP-binding protein